MAVTTRDISWNNFKNRVNRKGLPIQFEDNPREYFVFTLDDGLEWSTRIVKDTADATDFENNYKPDANIQNPPSISTDAKKTPFGHQIGVEKHTFINAKSTVGLSSLRETVSTSGSATAAENMGRIELSTGTTDNSKVSVQTKERLNYVAGFTSESGWGISIPTLPSSGQQAMWGQFDENNGCGFGVDSTGTFVFVRKNGSDEKVYQGSWSIDNVRGDGPSGSTLDLTKGNLFETNFTWYGYGGNVLFKLFIGSPETKRRVIDLHEMTREGLVFIDPNLPLRVEIENGTSSADFKLHFAGRQASLIGIPERETRISSDFVNPTTLTTNDRIPLMSIRKKSTHQGRTNTVKCNLQNLELISSDAVLIEIFKDTSPTSPVWSSPSGIPSDETVIEVDKSATGYTGGTSRFKALSSPAEKGKGKQGRIDVRNIDGFILYENETITVTAKRLQDRETTVTLLVDIGEEW